jgi:hypothetical protein
VVFPIITVVGENTLLFDTPNFLFAVLTDPKSELVL